MANFDRISRAEKQRIGGLIVAHLKARLAAGPAEPEVDKYIPELEGVVTALTATVGGKSSAESARLAELATQDERDDRVDVWARHLESFLRVESHHRHGPHLPAALALYQGAFPDGLAHLDDRIVVENAHCRSALTVLRDPTHAATLQAIGLPSGWVDAFAKALDDSDAATVAVDAARHSKATAVTGGQDAEAQWEHVMVRLRNKLNGREGKEAEALALLAPLVQANALINAQDLARRTKKAKE